MSTTRMSLGRRAALWVLAHSSAAIAAFGLVLMLGGVLLSDGQRIDRVFDQTYVSLFGEDQGPAVKVPETFIIEESPSQLSNSDEELTAPTEGLPLADVLKVTGMVIGLGAFGLLISWAYGWSTGRVVRTFARQLRRTAVLTLAVGIAGPMLVLANNPGVTEELYATFALEFLEPAFVVLAVAALVGQGLELVPVPAVKSPSTQKVTHEQDAFSLQAAA